MEAIRKVIAFCAAPIDGDWSGLAQSIDLHAGGSDRCRQPTASFPRGRLRQQPPVILPGIDPLRLRRVDGDGLKRVAVLLDQRPAAGVSFQRYQLGEDAAVEEDGIAARRHDRPPRPPAPGSGYGSLPVHRWRRALSSVDQPAESRPPPCRRAGPARRRGHCWPARWRNRGCGQRAADAGPARLAPPPPGTLLPPSPQTDAARPAPYRRHG